MPSSFWKISFLWCDCVWIVAERLPAKRRQFKLMNHSERIICNTCLDFARHQVCVPDIWLPDLLLLFSFPFFSFFIQKPVLCVNTLASSSLLLLVRVNKKIIFCVVAIPARQPNLFFVVVFFSSSIIHFWPNKAMWWSLFVRALCL